MSPMYIAKIINLLAIIFREHDGYTYTPSTRVSRDVEPIIKLIIYSTRSCIKLWCASFNINAE